MKQKILLSILAIISTIFHINAQPQLPDPTAVELPVRYFQLLKAGIERVQKRLTDEKDATLASLEAQPGWSHFPNAILMPAVLYTKSHPSNKRYGDAGLLKLALQIGDMLVTEYDKGHYTARGIMIGILICGWKHTGSWKINWEKNDAYAGKRCSLRNCHCWNQGWLCARTIPCIMLHSSLLHPTITLYMHQHC